MGWKNASSWDPFDISGQTAIAENIVLDDVHCDEDNLGDWRLCQYLLGDECHTQQVATLECSTETPPEKEYIPPEGCTCVLQLHPDGFVVEPYCEARWGYEPFCYVEGDCQKDASARIPNAYYTDCLPNPNAENVVDCVDYTVSFHTGYNADFLSFSIDNVYDTCESDALLDSFSDYEYNCCFMPGDTNITCKNNSQDEGFHGSYITISGESYCH
eukprot:UN29701